MSVLEQQLIMPLEKDEGDTSRLNACLINCRTKLPKSALTYLLFCVFGIGSWIAVNGIWAEIAVLTITLPECYKLAAYLVVAIQIANVGPFLYTVVKYSFQRCGWVSKQIHLERVTVSLIVAIGTAACVLLAIFWDRTASLRGSTHSVALIILSFFVALVDCTSSVVFIPFMKHFPEEYISALYIGEGLSGVLPSAVALSQGFANKSITCLNRYPGHQVLGIHFSPNIFFIFLAFMMLLCGLAFLGINVLPPVRKHMMVYKYPQFKIKGNSRMNTPAPSEATLIGNDYEDDEEEIMVEGDDGGERSQDPGLRDDPQAGSHTDFSEDDLDGGYDTPPPSLTPPPPVEKRVFRREASKSRMPSIPSISSSVHFQSNDSKRNKNNRIETRVASGMVLRPITHKTARSFSCVNVVRILWTNLTIFVCLALLNFMTNGVLSAVSSYIFIPYGNDIYHLAINLALLANPIMSLFYVLVPFKSRVATAMMTSIALLLGLYLLVCAFLTPCPPFHNHFVGKIIIVSLLLLTQSVLI